MTGVPSRPKFDPAGMNAAYDFISGEPLAAATEALIGVARIGGARAHPTAVVAEILGDWIKADDERAAGFRAWANGDGDMPVPLRPQQYPLGHARAFADLANRVSDLEDHLRDAQHALRSDDDRDVDASSRTSVVAGFRLDDAAGQLTSVMNALLATARDLQIIGRRTDRTCEALWGVCPEHGAVLQGSGGRCWCNAPGCEREWDYDRMRLPCTEDAAVAVTFNDEGKTAKLCARHADFLAPDANVTRTPIGA